MVIWPPYREADRRAARLAAGRRQFTLLTCSGATVRASPRPPSRLYAQPFVFSNVFPRWDYNYNGGQHCRWRGSTMRTPLMALDACLLMTIGASTAGADPISLAPPPSTYVDQFYQGQWEGGPGISRELVFEDVAAFQLNSFGMEFNPSETTTTVTARLYEFTGTSTVGALLASSSVTVSDFGRGFYDVPLSYLLPGTGTRYMLSM